MKFVYIILGTLMMAMGSFATYDLVTHSGFDRIEHPVLGISGVAGPALFFIGLVFLRFRGRPFANRGLGIAAAIGVLVQTLATLPYVQPRLLAPTPGHAGMGLNEILSGLLILGGMGASLPTLVIVLLAKAKSSETKDYSR